MSDRWGQGVEIAPDHDPWDDNPHEEPDSAPVLVIEDVADISARVDAAPPRTWMVRGVLIEGQYGASVAPDTSGKSWAALDLAVNVSTGGRWLHTYECDTPGRVLMFLGEGDEFETTRRGRAVANHYGAVWEDLGLRICHRAPKLTVQSHLDAIRHELEWAGACLVIVDPLYLSLGGVQTSMLNEMGAVLGELQYVCQQAGASLWLSHHWNKGGTGTGRHRSTGSGIPEWARATASIDVVSRETDGTATVVTLDWEIVGNSAVDQGLRTRRRVWADDVADLSSPLHYELEVVDGADPVQNLSTSQRRVLAILERCGSNTALTVAQVQEATAHEAPQPPLKTRTVQQALKDLRKLQLARPVVEMTGHPSEWAAESQYHGEAPTLDAAA